MPKKHPKVILFATASVISLLNPQNSIGPKSGIFIRIVPRKLTKKGIRRFIRKSNQIHEQCLTVLR